MNPKGWAEMVSRTRHLEAALGSGCKKVEENEKDTVVLQRRGIYCRKALNKGNIIRKEDLILLRPCPTDALPANMIQFVLGKELAHDLEPGVAIRYCSIK
jgi:N-acetylneuraminate synthase